MSFLKEQKILQAKEISEKISKSQAVVVATYQGLTVKEIQTLRKLAKEKDVEIKVYKNRLVKKAIENTEFSSLSSTLVGANMFAFSYSDYISAAKVLHEFGKKHKQVELVSGIIEQKVADKQMVTDVATLPTYEEALTILATSLQAPIRQIGVGLKMLVDENKIKAE
ncbi:MAG: 50S ribosomal protein L10 [Mycoplasma sp.]|nr:50S ribosomal protein L10 [Mycoplasma sp.]